MRRGIRTAGYFETDLAETPCRRQAGQGLAARASHRRLVVCDAGLPGRQGNPGCFVGRDRFPEAWAENTEIG